MHISESGNNLGGFRSRKPFSSFYSVRCYVPAKWQILQSHRCEFSRNKKAEIRSPTYRCRFFRANRLAEVGIFREEEEPLGAWLAYGGATRHATRQLKRVTMKIQAEGNEKAVNLIDKSSWRLSIATLNCCLSTLSNL